jgi:hypothetical protein
MGTLQCGFIRVGEQAELTRRRAYEQAAFGRPLHLDIAVRQGVANLQIRWPEITPDQVEPVALPRIAPHSSDC